MSEERRWVWESETGRYRDLTTGRFIASSEIQELVNGIVDRTTDGPVSVLNTMLGDHRLSTADWESAFARLIKNAYIQQAELAAGGRDQMTAQLWGSLGTPLREQYGYLANFVSEIEAGTLTLAQIEARTKMYINSSREAYWRVKDIKAREIGFTQERWHAVGDAGTCNPCFDADAMGWQPLGFFAQPGSGVVIRGQSSCKGLTNCRCEKTYR